MKSPLFDLFSFTFSENWIFLRMWICKIKLSDHIEPKFILAIIMHIYILLGFLYLSMNHLLNYSQFRSLSLSPWLLPFFSPLFLKSSFSSSSSSSSFSGMHSSYIFNRPHKILNLIISRWIHLSIDIKSHLCSRCWATRHEPRATGTVL